ncbi:MAG: Glu-tRNA(Gln) amidotransferase GatDE subunit E, partial [archaeon]
MLRNFDKENLDFGKFGLKIGLEIHQQLDTKKLFCNCESKLIKDDTKANCEIKRKLRAATSESGEVDITAKIEQAKDKIFNYNFYNSCNCLVEADCQPPFSINKEALVIVGVISKLTNSS